jgi:capsular exopolysaccharide synthesis family protein
MSEGGKQPQKGSEPEVQRFARVLSERRWVLVASAVAGVGLFALWAVRQPRIYQARASLVVDYTPPQILGGEVRDVVQVGPGHFYAMQDYLNTQKRVLTSDTLALRVVKRLGLEGDHAFWGPGLPPTPEAAAQRFVGGVTAEPVTDTQIIAVSYRHTDPKQAKRAADGLLDTYLESNMDLRDNSNVSASRWLADEADSLRGRLNGAELALYDFKKHNDLLSVSLEDRMNSVSRQIDKLSDALTDVRLRKIQRTSEAEQLARMSEVDPTVIVPAAAPPGDTLGLLKKDLAEEERRLSELRARYEDAHPLVRQSQAKVQAVRMALQREVGVQMLGARARINETIEQEKKIATQLEAAKQEGLRITRLEVDYLKLKREAESLAKQYLMVENRTKETQLASRVKVNNLHVLDYARIPTTPISPRLGRSFVLAMLFALSAGVLLAFLIDALDRTLKSQEDVEAKLALPFLGILPHVTGASAELHVAANPQSAAAECCRLLRTNLLFAGLSRPLKRLLVTSSIAREGKTLTTVSLGAVFAQSGNKVLLMDGDLRRPRLRSALFADGAPPGIDPELGLTSVLLGTVPLEQAIQPTGTPNLFVLLSGPVPPNPAELVDGPRFRQVLDECAEKFERVLIDSPPAVPVTDPAILATYCDGVLLVVRSGKTTHDSAQRARRNLVDVGARILGVVLNDCNIRRSGYGGYGYKYGYGYYSSKRSPTPARVARRG